ncbi:MalY/PatB family protein [Aquirufa ecclesiirivi]|uniref:MalY/PatB family protein n=1 Tax=Aquirufa ecclesiirivi TaxID=2715124 RepID=UPI0022A812F0|nr:aminotransferase class I/II-fold pyridoxal phosphate-dependent enzyme [Aquirufa ecclesiirivi]MCZ2472064.1 aminotransferase class I/II-fold pyridoxal phosphate-dependent enzyme [Aquirufa ecclesiirivi]
MKKYNFDQVIDRKNTSSYKWDNPMYAGKSILPMPVADMEFVVADEILEALDKITQHGVLGYSIVPDSLKLLAQKRIQEEYQWETAVEWQVWLPGIVPGISIACDIFSNEKNGVLTAIPVYHPFHLIPTWLNRPLLTFPMVEKEGRWTYDFEAFEEALKQQPAVFLFCNPHNPGGTVFNQSEIDQIVRLCKQYNCLIISDEIHADLRIHPQSKHICIGQYIEDIPSISFFATSKAFNTAGLGGCVAIIPHKASREAFIKRTFGFMPMLSRHSIDVMSATYLHGSNWLAQLLPYLKQNHDFLLDFVKQQPGLDMIPLEATYLAWISYDETWGDLPERLLEHGLHVLRGEQFKGKNFIRLNFACPQSQLQEACQIIASLAL